MLAMLLLLNMVLPLILLMVHLNPTMLHPRHLLTRLMELLPKATMPPNPQRLLLLAMVPPQDQTTEHRPPIMVPQQLQTTVHPQPPIMVHPRPQIMVHQQLQITEHPQPQITVHPQPQITEHPRLQTTVLPLLQIMVHQLNTVPLLTN